MPRVDKTTGGYDTQDYRLLKSRWRSGDHVGEARPTMRAYCRTVKLIRRYEQVPQGLQFSHIPGLPDKVGPNEIWRGRWNPKTEWKALPNVLSFRLDQDFDSNGVATATVEIDNVGVIEQTGVAGVYHTMERGYYAPHRGADVPGRPSVASKNEWFDILADKSCQIILLAGYGSDAVVPVLSGLVNDMEIGSRPDRISLTCRDVGQVLTDQHVFMNAKERSVKDPITFADRRSADNTEEKAHSPQARNHASGFGPRFAIDGRVKTAWRSRDYDRPDPNNMPWLQIGLPHGRYENFRLDPAYSGMSCYVAIKARDKNAPGGRGAFKRFYGTQYEDGEWIDEGLGTIPGTSIPYVKKINKVKAGQQSYRFGDYGYMLGDDSKIRLYFTNLASRKSSTGKNRVYRAAVSKFAGVRRKTQREAIREEWILVDDLSDVVRTVFQWAGINDWEVETTGVRLKEKTVFNRGNFLIDIIQAAAEQVGYTFYIKPPESFDEDDLESLEHDYSMGIGVFRQNQAMRRQADTLDPVELVHEDTVLQGVQARFTDEPLAFNIRVRGRKVKEKKGGRILGGDDTPRFMYVYRPPWARGQSDVYDYYGGKKNQHRELSASPDWRNANIKKYVVHHDNKLRSLQECKIAALIIAFREALEAAQATVEFPAMPTIQLDHQLGLFDTGTGLSTRLWVVARQMEYRGGPQGHFKMSVGGSLIDLPDIGAVRRELVQAIRNENYNPGLSEHELENWKHVYRNA